MAAPREAALPAALGAGAVTRRRRVASEAALVRAAQGGSAEAMEELFRRHWPAAHRAAWLVVHDAAAAEDAAQEAFLAAVRALHRFDRRRPFAPWLLVPAAPAPGSRARIVAIAAVARRFGGAPVVRGWCCPAP